MPSQPLFKKVVIIGVGLMGGSIGLGLKKRHLAQTVVGVVRSNRSKATALKTHAVDKVLNLENAVQGADLIILATPTETILEQLKELGRLKSLLKENAMIMDIGSAKRRIQQAAKKCLKGIRFVGCHPMAGSEKRGVENADPDLFVGASYFTTSKNVPPKIIHFWDRMGMEDRIPATPQEHDRWVAKSSHLIHLSAFIHLILLREFIDKISIRGGNPNPSLKAIARLAKSDAANWTEIFLANHEEILSSINDFKLEMKKFENAIRKKDFVSLRKIIKSANMSAAPLKTNDPR